jgi:hypothetical protein
VVADPMAAIRDGKSNSEGVLEIFWAIHQMYWQMSLSFSATRDKIKESLMIKERA